MSEHQTSDADVEAFKAEVQVWPHRQPKREPCEHDFQGWREFDDGNGGEAVCTKCGLGAMAHTLRQEGWG